MVSDTWVTWRDSDVTDGMLESFNSQNCHRLPERTPPPTTFNRSRPAAVGRGHGDMELEGVGGAVELLEMEVAKAT